MKLNPHNTSQINIVFFGTSDRAIPILNSLNNNFNLKFCVTKKDSLFGRNKILKPTEVKTWSRTHNIPIYELNNLNHKVCNSLIYKFNKLEINYGIVADFSYIIPESIINYFNNRLINIHFSMLPKYRGASPVQFAIKNGDKKTGITFQLISKELDRGAIIYQYEYTIHDNKSSGEIYDDMFKLSGEILPEVIRKYSKNVLILKEQDESEATYTYSKTHPKKTTIFKEDAEIDWNINETKLHNFIRAFNPWPIAWTSLNEFQDNFLRRYNKKCKLKKHINKSLTLKIYKSEIHDNTLEILELQVEGKKKMLWIDFINGYLECD